MARLQLPGRRHDLPAATTRCCSEPLDARARQAAPARPLGHDARALNFIYAHLNRVIKRDDLDVIFIAGPGHGAPGAGRQRLPRGHLQRGLPGHQRRTRRACRSSSSSSPSPAASPATSRRRRRARSTRAANSATALSHAYGAAFDNPDLIVACVVGDGEAETGPAGHRAGTRTSSSTRRATARCCRSCTSTATRSPTRPILARISHEELEALFVGYGYDAVLRRGRRPGDDAPADGGDARRGDRGDPRASSARRARTAARPSARAGR
ncbi:MAG: hypothetical protein MZV65_18385 [Chromatiales bacterium]|nr:hypothetical protein [Chromatiales bacterium]